MPIKLVVTAITLLISSAAIATDRNLHSDLDINNDGGVSKEEAAALPGLNDKWAELDENSDGMLDPAEFAKLEFKGTVAE